MADEILRRLVELKQGQMALQQHIDARLDGVDSRFGGIEARFDRIEARLDRLEVGQKQLAADLLDHRRTTTTSFEMISRALEHLGQPLA